jgi:sugar phosphate isomerase/epimerase
MRLGVCGMLPPNFRDIDTQHLEAIRALNLSGGAFHYDGAKLFDISDAECRTVRDTFTSCALDLPQFGIGYGECLFDPSESVRQRVIAKIERGIEVARLLDAQTCLIRTGSLNPQGAYAPAKENRTPQARELLVETLKTIAAKAESEGVDIVIETHLLTIMGSPEINREVLDAVDSARFSVVMDYVNHFQNLDQVYDSTARIEHIFSIMNAISVVGHCKDIKLSNGLVLHIDEEIPGDGELDLTTALRLWHEAHPDGYMLLEHLPEEQYPRAAENAHRIIKEAHIPLH